jgi:hypothetical protein
MGCQTTADSMHPLVEADIVGNGENNGLHQTNIVSILTGSIFTFFGG